jgi:hypothetical protein
VGRTPVQLYDVLVRPRRKSASRCSFHNRYICGQIAEPLSRGYRRARNGLPCGDKRERYVFVKLVQETNIKLGLELSVDSPRQVSPVWAGSCVFPVPSFVLRCLVCVADDDVLCKCHLAPSSQRGAWWAGVGWLA